MSDAKRGGQSIGIHIVDCHDVTMDGNEIRGFSRGIVAEKSTEVRAFRNVIEKRIGKAPPQNLVEATVNLLQQSGRAANVRPTEAEVRSAAESTGLKKWLVEHGVDVAGFFVSIISLFK